LNGFPATVAPIARSANGLPVGAQIIGGCLEDRSPIAFVGLVDREFGGFTPPPNLCGSLINSQAICEDSGPRTSGR